MGKDRERTSQTPIEVRVQEHLKKFGLDLQYIDGKPTVVEIDTDHNVPSSDPLFLTLYNFLNRDIRKASVFGLSPFVAEFENFFCNDRPEKTVKVQIQQETIFTVPSQGPNPQKARSIVGPKPPEGTPTRDITTRSQYQMEFELQKPIETSTPAYTVAITQIQRILENLRSYPTVEKKKLRNLNQALEKINKKSGEPAVVAFLLLAAAMLREGQENFGHDDEYEYYKWLVDLFEENNINSAALPNPERFKRKRSNNSKILPENYTNPIEQIFIGLRNAKLLKQEGETEHEKREREVRLSRLLTGHPLRTLTNFKNVLRPHYNLGSQERHKPNRQLTIPGGTTSDRRQEMLNSAFTFVRAKTNKFQFIFSLRSVKDLLAKQFRDEFNRPHSQFLKEVLDEENNSAILNLRFTNSVARFDILYELVNVDDAFERHFTDSS